MKYSIVLVSVFAASAIAQVNECGQKCISNMLDKASSLGCPGGASDPSCLCKNPDFGFGLKDCALEACGAAQESAVVSFGTSYCATALAAGASSSASSASDASGASTVATTSTLTSATGTVTVTSTTGTAGTESESSTSGSAGGAGAGGPVAISTETLVTGIAESSTTVLSTIGTTTLYSSESDATPVTTAPVVGVVTSGGSTFTATTASTTIYGEAGGAGSGNGSAISTSAIVSTVTSGSSTFATTVGSSTISAEASSSAGSGSGGSSSSSSSSALGAQATAMPIFMAAAGLAALIL